jgi:hypothetical protein
MTAFQRLVEMPLTSRGTATHPPASPRRATSLAPRTARGRHRLNEATHLALGTLWGGAYGVAASRGLRGQKAVNVVFGVVYTGDVLLNTRSACTGRRSGPCRLGGRPGRQVRPSAGHRCRPSTGCSTRRRHDDGGASRGRRSPRLRHGSPVPASSSSGSSGCCSATSPCSASEHRPGRGRQHLLSGGALLAAGLLAQHERIVRLVSSVSSASSTSPSGCWPSRHRACSG